MPRWGSGLSDTAWLCEPEQSEARRYKLDRDDTVELPVILPPHGAAWFVINDSGAASQTSRQPQGNFASTFQEI